MLKKIRIALAALFWVGITALFLDSSGLLTRWTGWMADIQLVPAVLALNVLAITAVLVITLLFGRIYCSVICPLGITQDIISWLRGKFSKKKRFRFKYRRELPWLRYCVLVIFIVLMVAGLGSIAALIAPYSTYGRIVSTILRPSLVTGIVAGTSLALIVTLAWWDGRIWCNTICPVGSFLGIFSRISLFAPSIDTDKCRSCGLCGRQCKSSCIDMAAHSIDTSRCVVCMDCISTCKEAAIRFRLRRPSGKRGKTSGTVDAPADAGRRAFLAGTAIIAGTAALKAAAPDGSIVAQNSGLAGILPRKAPERSVIPVPPGSSGIRHIAKHCTACQLCVSKCPNNVLRPSGDPSRFLQPEMDFTAGWCRPECTICSEVCPTGAIEEITREEKTAIQTGHAVVDFERCLVYSKDEKCFNCIRHCPSRAITTVKVTGVDGKEKHVPAVNESKCLGCGACEYLCPVRPVSAIHVEGHETHRTI